MNKKFKKICSFALTLAITASSAISMSVSAYTDRSNFAGYTIIDDKGMMSEYDGEDYKMIYVDQWNSIVRAEPYYGLLQFVLSEDVDYEEANERIIEIFEEFYPDNYLGVSEVPTDLAPTNENCLAFNEYYDNYKKNYKPNLRSNTEDGVTTYTLIANSGVRSPNDEKVAAVRKYSKAFMEKLNEEKLISAFYDFGEVYYASGPYCINIGYSLDADIDLIYKYIDEHNIDCTIEKDDYCYTLKFNDDTSKLEKFLIAANIYEETSIKVDNWMVIDLAIVRGGLYGKNALEDLTETTTEPATEPATTDITAKVIGDANGDNKLDIRDAAFIAQKLAKYNVVEHKLESKVEEFSEWADYNGDGVVNIRDAAAIAKDLAARNYTVLYFNLYTPKHQDIEN